MLNGTNSGLNSGTKLGRQRGTNVGTFQGRNNGFNTGQPYDVDAWNYIQAIQASGIPIDKQLWNNFVITLKKINVWDNCDLIYPVYGGTALAHGINLKNPGQFPITWGGGMVHSPLGVVGNGTTSFGTTTWVPSTSAVKFKQNDASMGAYAYRTNTISTGIAGVYFGVVSSSGGSTIDLSSNYDGGDGISFSLNDSGFATGGPGNLPKTGLISMTRNANNSSHANFNGRPNVVANTTIFSTTPPNVPLYFMALNNQGISTGGFTNAICSFFYIGNSKFNQMDLFIAVENLQLALGRSAFGS